MKIEVQGSGKSPYIVDTEELTCTCPHFRFRSRHHSVDNPDRLCKHLLQVFEKHPELKPAFLSKLESSTVDAGVDPDGKIRYPRSIFDPYVYDIRSLLHSFDIVKKFEFCGSYRRLMPRVSDLDVLLTLETDTASPDPIFNYCEEILNYHRLWRGDKKTSYKVDGYIQVDFKVIPNESWVYAICHYTGSKDENIRLRRIANSKGLTLNEYGVYKDKEFVGQGIESEEDLYKFLGVPYKSPAER